jgi:hypothetical protein
MPLRHTPSKGQDIGDEDIGDGSDFLRNRRKAGSRPNRPDRSRKSTQPAANGVVEFSRFEFLDRLADLVPLPRKSRHRYHGVFAPNHPLRPAVTAPRSGTLASSAMP